MSVSSDDQLVLTLCDMCKKLFPDPKFTSPEENELAVLTDPIALAALEDELAMDYPSLYREVMSRVALAEQRECNRELEMNKGARRWVAIELHSMALLVFHVLMLEQDRQQVKPAPTEVGGRYRTHEASTQDNADRTALIAGYLELP